MSTTLVPTSFDEAAFEQFLESRVEPAWVTQMRRDAFEQLQQSFEEELDPEEYRRVGLRSFRPDRYRLATEAPATASEFSTLLADRADFAGHVAFVDGHNTRSELSEEFAAKGVLFGDLTSLLTTHGDQLKPHLLTRAVEPNRDRFSLWHTAFFTGGTVLYVPRNVELSQPLHSLIGLATENATDLSHTLVIVEDNASATLLEETVSATDDAGGLHIGAVELLIGSGARLRYVQLQNWNQKTYHLAHQCGRVERDASLQWTVGGLGSKLAHIHQDVHLDGRGAEGEVNGVTFATDRQTISYYTQQSHNAEDTRSDLLYKQVLRDKAKVIWRGMIRVEAEAQKTDGYQKNDALMLSDTCRNDAIPGLEIEADDVRCTHGATAGQVDEEQVFYAMSRGLSRYEAMHMIVEGFLQAVVDRVPVEAVRETLSQAVERKLGIGD